MIELSNIENQITLKCDVVGYQFPDDLEDNWCLLKVEVKQIEEVFEAIDPALETTDLVTLYDWFKCLSEKRLPKFAEITFVEPCISFEFLTYQNGKIRIAVKLSHELKPNFKLKQFKFYQQEWNIVFVLDDKDFKKILNGIEAVKNQYPSRS